MNQKFQIRKRKHYCKAKYFTDVNKILPHFELKLANHKWLTGDNIFIGDFYLWSVLDMNECLEESFLSGFPNLKLFKENVEKLPAIGAYLESEKFQRFPINGPTAKWGSKGNQ